MSHSLMHNKHILIGFVEDVEIIIRCRNALESENKHNKVSFISGITQMPSQEGTVYKTCHKKLKEEELMTF